jgi:NADPH:quinone reductase-like Zn-dependent oxidoreductase
MKAVRVHQIGRVDSITYEDLPCPMPEKGQVLVRVKAAGVGPWDAWVRAGKSVLFQPLPLILGSDLSGVVQSVGNEVSNFQPGDEIFGVTSPQFTGAQAEYALAEADMILGGMAAFLTAHRNVALDEAPAAGHDPARPDIVLFNGGVFESPAIKARLLEVLEREAA